MKKRMIALLTASVLLLSGCSGLSRLQDIFGLRSEPEKFEAYLQELFEARVCSDLLNYHYTIYEEENFDFPLEKPETAWGEFSLDDYLNYEEDVQESLDALTAFQYDKLTPEQQFIYDINLTYYENELDSAPYYLYATNFNTSGIHSQLPVLLAEYQFYEVEDIDDYLKLLDESYDYIESLLTFETYRAEQGYRLSDYTIDTVIENCREFIDSDPNVLITVFEEKLAAFPELEEQAKKDYQDANQEALTESLLPAYELIISKLEETRTLCDAPEPLGATEEGKEYYEYLIRYHTGTSESISKLSKATEQQMYNCLVEVMSLMQEDSTAVDEYYDYVAPETSPEEILLILQEKLTADFPELEAPKYEVKYVSKALEEMLNPAFYMVPPIDSKEKNTIYINGSPRFEHYNLLTTLAHEGFPGHLYQQNYFYTTNPHYIRGTLSFLGYSEGWATYVEHYYGYSYSDMRDACAVVGKNDSLLGLALSTYVDFGVNYYGWDLAETEEYLSSMGYSSSELAEQIYNAVFDDPAAYSSYCIGCMEIINLREKAEKKLKEDFNLKEFHQFLLETGPAPFDLIEDKMKDWIKEQ